MEGGPPSFTQSSTSSVLLWNAEATFIARYRTVTFYGSAFLHDSRSTWVYHIGAHNPRPKAGLGCSAFARRY